MIVLKILSSVYSKVGIIFASIYHWLVGEREDNPAIDDDDSNPVMVQPNVPPVPPPLAGLQIFAAMQFPFLQRNRPSLRDLLRPLAEALTERPTTPQPQLRLGKRWRSENQAENVEAIEKALEQYEEDNISTKPNCNEQSSNDEHTEPKDSRDEICSNTDDN